VKQILAIDRKFVNIKLDSLSYKESDILKVVEAHHLSLKSMEIWFSYFHSHLFMEILSSMENLETLTLRNSSFLTTNDVTFNAPKHLRHLKLNGGSWNILEFLSSASIFSLKAEHTCGDIEPLKTFLSTQTRLETLALEGRSMNIAKLFKNDLTSEDAKFQLKTLKLSDFKTDATIDDKAETNFLKFLKTHGKNLREIEVKAKLTPKIYEYIITKLTSLEKLLLDVQNLPFQKEFYTYLRPSKCIKELTLVEKFKDDASDKFMQAVLGAFSQVESLSVSHCEEASLKFLASKYQKLKCLHIKRIPFTHLPLNLKFQALKSFHVDEIRSIANWCLFLHNNPTIERLTVQEIYLQMISGPTVEAIIDCPNIKHIQLKGGLKAMKEFLEIINIIGYNKLESMELIVKNMNESFARPFYFDLPKDKTLWDGKCPYLDDFIWTKEL
jgi:hypothetical protein